MASTACSVCSEEVGGPLLTCMTCADDIDRDGVARPAVYCSTSCMAADSEAHARVCSDKNTRKQLYRAGKLLQDVFHTWRMATFDLSISGIGKKDDGTLFFKEHKYTDGGAALLYDFPANLCTDLKDEAAILCFLTCADSVSYTYELAKAWLKDTTTVIEEAIVSVTPGSFVVHRYFTSGVVDPVTDYSTHQILAIEAKDGKPYIIDLAGAQLNQHRAVVPFHEYMDDLGLVTTLSGLYHHGYMANWTKQVLRGEKDHEFASNPGHDFRINHLTAKIHKALLASVASWEKQNNTSVAQILSSPQADYERNKTFLLARIKEDLGDYICKWKAAGRPVPTHISRPPPMLAFFQELGLADEPDSTVQSTSNSTASKRWRADKMASVVGAVSAEERAFIQQFEAEGGRHIFL